MYFNGFFSDASFWYIFSQWFARSAIVMDGLGWVFVFVFGRGGVGWGGCTCPGAVSLNNISSLCENHNPLSRHRLSLHCDKWYTHTHIWTDCGPSPVLYHYSGPSPLPRSKVFLYHVCMCSQSAWFHPHTPTTVCLSLKRHLPPTDSDRNNQAFSFFLSEHHKHQKGCIIAVRYGLHELFSITHLG